MRLPFELFLALRYLRPKRTFVSIISILSLLGVMLGVMVLILVISVMSGFERDLREKIMGFSAHVTVKTDGILRQPGVLLPLIESNQHVLGASPFVTGPVLVEFNHRISTPFIRGFDPKREERVSGMGKYLVQGEFLLEGEAVIIGEDYALNNDIQLGDKLLIFSPKNIEDFQRAARKGEKVAYLPTELLVTGIFSTGMYDYDANYLVVSLEIAQELYNLGNGVHGIALKVRDPMQAEKVKTDLNPLLKRFDEMEESGLAAYTWMDMNRQLFSAIAVERNVMFFLLLFIIVVAAFGLSSTLITITVQKSREIGLLKAIGAGEGQILWVFLAHGLIVGVVGSLFGLISGALLLRFRNDVAHFLASVLRIEIFPAEIYQFASIPADVNPHDFILICFSAVLICTLAALIPAWSAARLQPAQALRYE